MRRFRYCKIVALGVIMALTGINFSPAQTVLAQTNSTSDSTVSVESDHTDSALLESTEPAESDHVTDPTTPADPSITEIDDLATAELNDSNLFTTTADSVTNWASFKTAISVPQTETTATYISQNVLASFATNFLRYWSNSNALRHFSDSPVYGINDLPSTLTQLNQSQLKTAWPTEYINASRGNQLTLSTFFEMPSLAYSAIDAQYAFELPQGMTKLGQYFYFFIPISFYNGTSWYSTTDSAVIVRIDEKINQYEASDGWGIARVIREANQNPNYSQIPYDVFAKYAEYIRVSEPFDLEGGHGGSISHDGTNIWISVDRGSDLSTAGNTYMRMFKYSTDLQLQKKYYFKLYNTVGGTTPLRWTAFAFTGPGVFYAIYQLDGYRFFRGTINETNNTISVTALKNVFTNKIGPYIQGMSYNWGNQRLYLAGDAVIASFYPSLLSDANPNWRSVQYTELGTQRESEGIAFDDNGKNLYLLVIHSAEVFKSPVYEYPNFDYDVSLGERADDIVWMMQSGFAAGTVENSVTTFRASDAVSRGAMAEFFYNLSGKPAFTPTASVKAKFKDIGSLNAGRKTAIYWLAQNKITLGCNTAGTLFCPTRAVNRGSMAEFMAKLSKINLKSTNSSSFPDVFTGSAKTITYKSASGNISKTKVAALSGTRVAAINWLAANGITLGSQTTKTGVLTYRPQDSVNRGAMAQFLRRWYTGSVPHPYQK